MYPQLERFQSTSHPHTNAIERNENRKHTVGPGTCSGSRELSILPYHSTDGNAPRHTAQVQVVGFRVNMSPTYKNYSRIKRQGNQHTLLLQLLTHPANTLSRQAEMASQGYLFLVPRLTIRPTPWNRHGHQRYSTLPAKTSTAAFRAPAYAYNHPQAQNRHYFDFDLPARIASLLPKTLFTDGTPLRVSASSMTSSWNKEAAWIISVISASRSCSGFTSCTKTAPNHFYSSLFFRRKAQRQEWERNGEETVQLPGGKQRSTSRHHLG